MNIYSLLSSLKAYTVKPEKLLVPMAKGEHSKKAFDLALGLASNYKSEITALTIKDEAREIVWSDKVAIVLNAYKEAKERNIRLVPKVQSAKNIKQGIVSEINSKNYDMVIFSSGPRATLSASLLGGIGDYIIKNSRATVLAITSRMNKYKYERVLVPVTESLNVRRSLYIALMISKVFDAKVNILDLRKFDRKETHGFKNFFDSIDEIKKEYPNIEFSKSEGNNMKEIILGRAYSTGADLLVFGVRPGTSGNIRINGLIKDLIKEMWTDTILIKK
ncbi:MAG: universal stress protein [Thermoplasmataceae archaeon]|nr:MAG: hypothetical protein AMDU2_EPLC00005G0236 [Thermoplasmatales archaeon E-plasma]